MADVNGYVALDALTPEDITRILSEGRNKGGYERFISRTVESGEMAVVVTLDPEFTAKEAASVLNSLTQNIAKLSKERGWPELKAVKRAGLDEDDPDKVHVVLINLEAHREAVTA